MTLEEFRKSDREQYEAVKAKATRLEYTEDYDGSFGEDHAPGMTDLVIHAHPAKDIDTPTHDSLKDQCVFMLGHAEALRLLRREALRRLVRGSVGNVGTTWLKVHVKRTDKGDPGAEWFETHEYAVEGVLCPSTGDLTDEIVLIASFRGFTQIRKERSPEKAAAPDGDKGLETVKSATDDGSKPSEGTQSVLNRMISILKGDTDDKPDTSKEQTGKDDGMFHTYTCRIETKDGKTTVTTSTDGGTEKTTTFDTDTSNRLPSSTWNAWSRMERAFDEMNRFNHLFKSLW